MNRIYTFGISMALAAGFGMTANAAEEIALLGTKPADGSTIKSMSELTILLPSWDEEKGEPINFTLGMETFMYGFHIDNKEGEPVLTAENIESMDMGEEYDMNIGQIPTAIFYFSTTLATDGEYTLVIPAGSFVESTFNPGGELGDGPAYSSAEYTATFTIDSNAASPLDTYTLTPESGTELESIESISLLFPNVTSNQWNYEYPSGKFTNGVDEYEAFASLDYNNEEGLLAFNVMPLKDDEPFTITKADEWTLIFDAGSIVLQDGTSNQNSIRATYTVVGGQTGVKYNLSPAAESTIDTVEFILSFPGSTKAEYKGEYYSFIVKSNETMVALPGLEVTEVEAAFPTFKLTPSETAGKLPNGSITLIIEEGTFEVNGKPTEEIVANYTLDQPVSTDWMADPYEGPVTIYPDGFYFTFIFDETAIVSTPEKSDITITVNDEELPAESYDVWGEGYMLLFGCADKKYYQDGTLKVVIKEGAFKIADVDSPAIEHEWELKVDESVISGVSSIFNSNGNVTVFSIDGKKLLDNAAADSLRGLAKGVYVINGKKVLVK